VTVRRRTLLLAAAATPLAGCGAGALQGFSSFDAARRAIGALPAQQAKTSGGWGLPQVLQHAAQSIDYSITGYPEMKSAAFRGSVGAAAWAVFDARGAMRHTLDEPIPGAPALDAALTLPAAVDRLLAAMQRFEAHTGALQPHFAYGEIGRASWRERVS
jgi:hypothetical protein